METVPETFPDVSKFVPTQDTAFEDDHVSVELEPEATEVGDADKVAVGPATVVEVTVTELLLVPPAPVQLTVYVFVLLGETLKVPDVALPVEKFVPVQEVAFVEDQVRIDDAPLVTDVGLAVIVAVGTVFPIHAAQFALLLSNLSRWYIFSV